MKPASPGKPESPFDIPPEVAARCSGLDQFDAAARKIVAEPKVEIDAAKTKWKRSQAKKRLRKSQSS